MLRQLPVQASRAGHRPHKARLPTVKSQQLVNALAAARKPMAIKATMAVVTEPIMVNRHPVAAKIAHKANTAVASAAAISQVPAQHREQLNRQLHKLKLLLKYLSLKPQA